MPICSIAGSVCAGKNDTIEHLQSGDSSQDEVAILFGAGSGRRSRGKLK